MSSYIVKPESIGRLSANWMTWTADIVAETGMPATTIRAASSTRISINPT